MINKVIEDLEVEIQNSSSTYESTKLKYKLSFFKRASSERPEYDYSKVEYINSRTKVEVICKEHGSFHITPNNLLNGCGCMKCYDARRGKSLKLTKSSDTFIQRVREVSPQYDYSKVEYTNNKTKVEVICKEHGSFFAQPNTLLRGCGCMKCYDARRGKSVKLTYDKFKKKLLEQDKGHLSIKDEDYKGSFEPLVFTCSIHGVQYTNKAYNLIESRYGCPKCGKDMAPINTTTSFEDLVKRLEKRYKGKITIYENTYTTLSNDIKANCKLHGDFISKPNLMLKNNHGCPSCNLENRGKKRIMPFSEFLEKANKQFNNKYTYLEETYTKSKAKMKAICPTHGIIDILPYKHLRQEYGCYLCGVEAIGSYITYFDKPTTLYYIKLIKGDEEYFKLGITTTTLKKRFYKLNSEGLTYEIIATKTFETGISAYHLEQYLLHKYNSYRIAFILLPKSGGNSEIFNQDIYESIKQYFD